MNGNSLFEQALVLPESERLRLVEFLLESLPPDIEESEEASRTELHRRGAEFDNGLAEFISWDQLKNEKD